MAVLLGLQAELYYWNPGDVAGGANETPRTAWPVTGIPQLQDPPDKIWQPQTGTFGLVEVCPINDVTLSLSKGEADISTRCGGGFRQRKATLKDGEVSFTMMWDPENVAVQSFFDVWNSLGGFIGLAVMDRAIYTGTLAAPVAEVGVQGLWGDFEVFDFVMNQPLEEAQNVEVTLRLSDGVGIEPEWVNIQ